MWTILWDFQVDSVSRVGANTSCSQNGTFLIQNLHLAGMDRWRAVRASCSQDGTLRAVRASCSQNGTWRLNTICPVNPPRR